MYNYIIPTRASAFYRMRSYFIECRIQHFACNRHETKSMAYRTSPISNKLG